MDMPTIDSGADSLPSVDEARENLYSSLANENKDIDFHLANLKAAMKQAGDKELVLDPARLFQNNREGRKMLQSYCKRRGLKIKFKD